MSNNVSLMLYDIFFRCVTLKSWLYWLVVKVRSLNTKLIDIVFLSVTVCDGNHILDLNSLLGYDHVGFKYGSKIAEVVFCPNEDLEIILLSNKIWFKHLYQS